MSHQLFPFLSSPTNFIVLIFLSVVPMPSSQFEFKLTNTSVGELDDTHSSVVGLQSGFTQLVLVDKSIFQNDLEILVLNNICK